MKNISEEQLEELEIFNGVSKSSLSKLKDFGEVKKYQPGNHLFRDKEEVSTLYVVLSGSISLYKLNENGNKRVIFILGRGKMINDVIIQDLPSSINCEIFEESYILSYDKYTFLKIMEDDFILTKNVMFSLAMKVRRLYRQLKNATGVVRMEKKLAAKLWKLSRDYGVKCEDGVTINMNISVTYLADLLGSKRETVSRSLKILLGNKLIKYENKKIKVIDQDKLSKFFKAP
ncbi:Crp/Fnr family transcriptional regulator [Clostridium beijerinckii]|uniref:CRP-like cAMP-binding protein n=1 Tax=Clostridium beijerinckii TaxID=1520 RepID=A0A9Q5GPG8_CLOBE|nr:Crp/Fnr family transcriptional regulator [Clostridium beijerinckii]AQS03392.1 cAMP receptor protein [Clostridium beijerinckii]MBA2884645.1 CRP-like cAMP-binding protein [Clostridium beijerinckii]MBA2899367.1 CRP-like cAMP-binding protein [Clostridium beijerinckii]MBA2908996.1 CRP-like cAMP-binding protein [Clostridium beijerinckii]MBA9017069.1 CRP-like cAMP-binding protein [Clostridium beijerinckii]